MTNFHDVDRDLAMLYRVEPDEALYERALETTLVRLEQVFAGEADSAPATAPGRVRELRPRRRRFLPVFAMLIALLLLVAIAVAQPERFDWLFGDSPDDAANQVEVLEGPRSSAPAEPKGQELDAADSLRSLVGPPRNVGGDMAFFREQVTQPMSIPDDPERIGEALPLEEHMRLLLDERLDGAVVQVIAVPTTKGAVCMWDWIVIGRDKTFGGSCATELDDEHPLHAGRLIPATDGRTIVRGLVVDGVRAINVHTSADRLEPATLGRNAFAWRSPSRDLQPTGLQVVFADGRVVELGPTGAAKSP